MRRRIARRASAVALLTAVLFCQGVAAQNDEDARELRVLFIGNSLTYSNNLPAIVEALAKASNERRLVYRMVAYPNFSLEDHWNQGEARKALAGGKWDFVVLQQGPSASAEGSRYLIEYSRRFAQEIRRAGAKPALYMVWPSKARAGDFDGVSASHKRAAEETEAMLLPVGEAWRTAWRLDSGLALYSDDGFHPAPSGSYLAALVIYEQLYASRPSGLPAKLKLSSGSKVEVEKDGAKILQKAAAEANKIFGRRGK